MKRLLPGAPGARLAASALVIAALAIHDSRPAEAVDFSGTVEFTGQTVFAAPIAGIDFEDLVVSVDGETEATGNGERCSISATSSDDADLTGAYPSTGAVTADMLLERGGPQIPDGDCIVSVRAAGTDGMSVSARGSQTVFVAASDIDTSATLVVGDITVRESKAIAGVDKDCLKWLKKRLKLRAKCSVILLKKGPGGEEKCKDADPEPVGCDPGGHVEAILALAHGSNDQQTDPPSSEQVDTDALKDQLKCQQRLGKSAANFAIKRTKLAQKKCVDASADTEDCRGDQTRAARKKLGQIGKCTGDQLADGGTGRLVPDVGAPCDACIDAGVLDRKCLRSCFEIAIAELSDGVVGDVPECGNGIVQAGEFCDDGNLVNGDCCSSACGIEAGSPEGPMGDPTCTDSLDNDCDGDFDGADLDCQ